MSHLKLENANICNECLEEIFVPVNKLRLNWLEISYITYLWMYGQSNHPISAWLNFWRYL